MTDRIYSEAMYRFAEPEASYWEACPGVPSPAATPLTSNEHCDVAIIGGGYTGLSAAYHLCRDYQLDVRVLEAGHIGWGASGRNGGFCSLGGAGISAASMARKYGLEHARAYYASQVDAVGLVRELLADEGIDALCQGDREIATALSPKSFRQLKKHTEFQFRMLGLDSGIVTRAEFAERYFSSPLQHGGAFLRPTFGLHPLRLLRGLAAAAVRRGAQLHVNSEVVDWSGSKGSHCLRTEAGSVNARHVIVATNGYSPEHLHRQLYGRVLPMISSILVTRPLSSAELGAQNWQTDCPAITSVSLLNYFRLLPDGRFMFGGRGCADGSAMAAEQNFQNLRARMQAIFPGWRDVTIDFRWHGLVCMTRRLTPALGPLDDDPSVFFAFGFHGNGVNTAIWSGKKIAEWLGRSSLINPVEPESMPLVMRGMPAAFPLPKLRLSYVQAALRYRRLADTLRS